VTGTNSLKKKTKTPNKMSHPPKARLRWWHSSKRSLQNPWIIYFPGCITSFFISWRNSVAGGDADVLRGHRTEGVPSLASLHARTRDLRQDIKRKAEVVSISMVSSRHNVSADWSLSRLFIFVSSPIKRERTWMPWILAMLDILQLSDRKQVTHKI